MFFLSRRGAETQSFSQSVSFSGLSPQMRPERSLTPKTPTPTAITLRKTLRKTLRLCVRIKLPRVVISGQSLTATGSTPGMTGTCPSSQPKFFGYQFLHLALLGVWYSVHLPEVTMLSL